VDAASALAFALQLNKKIQQNQSEKQKQYRRFDEILHREMFSSF